MRLYKLEALRGFAAAYVVVHHAAPAHFYMFGFDWGLLFRFGHEAVMLFFLISGFVIHYSYQHSSDRSFRNYFLKRFTRIYGPLVFVFPLYYAISSAHAGALVDPEWWNLLGNLLMLQSLEPDALIEPYMRDKPLWSLTFEWWFYMMYFPLASRIADDEFRTRIVLGVSIAAAVCFQFFPAMAFRTLMYFGLWWCGVALAGLFIRGARIDFAAIRLPLAALIIIDLILALSFWMGFDLVPPEARKVYGTLELRHFGFATVALIAAVCWHRIGWIGFAVFKPFLILAPISYGMYISHFGIVRNRDYLEFIGNPFLEFAVAIALMFAVAFALERVLYPRIRRMFVINP
ncbi:MAG: acyltransferase [Myxococcota bacterium]